MTSKEKVLKIRPNAFCNPVLSQFGYQILAGPVDGRVQLGFVKNRESWAWADAYRNLTKKN